LVKTVGREDPAAAAPEDRGRHLRHHARVQCPDHRATMRAAFQGLVDSAGDLEPTAEAAWVSHVNDVGKGTLYPRANSWYVGANIPARLASSRRTSAASAPIASAASTSPPRATQVPTGVRP